MPRSQFPLNNMLVDNVSESVTAANFAGAPSREIVTPLNVLDHNNNSEDSEVNVNLAPILEYGKGIPVNNPAQPGAKQFR